MKRLSALIALALIAGSAYASAQACGVDDEVCWSEAYVASCAERKTSSIESCRRLLDTLKQQPATEAVRLATARAYGGLADLMEDESDARVHDREAERLLRGLLVDHPDNVDALRGVSVLTGDRAELLSLLERIVTLEPTDVIALEFLAEELIERGREGDMQRAAALFDQAFRVQVHDNRWRQAARAIGTYRRAGQPVDASRVEAQVREDLDVAGLLSSLEHTAELDPEVAQRAVDRLCLGSIVAILGANNCLYGISASAAAALDSESPDRAGAFAAAASHGMVGMAIRNTRVIPEEPPSKFINELEVLLSKGIESAALYYDYASLVRDPERRIWALENAIRLAPEDGDAAYRLAGIYEVTGQIDKAVAQLERARMLTRPAPVPPTWRSSASAWESIVEIRLEAIEMHLARLSTSAPTVRTLGGR